MNAFEFGEYIQRIREANLSRPDMASKAGLHFKTIRGYEKEGRLPDVDYLALLAAVSGHSFSELVFNRLEVKKVTNLQFLDIQDLKTNIDVNKQVIVIKSAISESVIYIDKSLLPNCSDEENCRYFGDQSEGIRLIDISQNQLKDGHRYLLDFGAGPLVRLVQYGLGGVAIK